MGAGKNGLEMSLRLFLSVDIAGSTAFKARSPDKVQPWLPALFRFFNEFPIRLNSEYQQGTLAAPRLWKTLGDEMVFVTELREYTDLKTHVVRFIATQDYYRTNIKDADSRLDLKGAAWLAGFPVHNSVLHLPSLSADGKECEDYVGPSLDVGFRIAKSANPRKFGLSVEAAYLLTKMAALGDHSERLDVLVEEGEALKGVLDGIPYPRFWTPMPLFKGQELWQMEETLLHLPRQIQQEKDICHFCKLFIETHKRPLFLPFIAGKETLGKPPEGYKEQYDEVVKMQQDLSAAMAEKEPKAGPQPKKPQELESTINAVGKAMASAAKPKTPRKHRNRKPKGKVNHPGR